jgi:DNA-binding response OmpR family regulator
MPATVTVRRILVVDKDASSRRVLSAALKHWDVAEVCVAKNTTEALKVRRASASFDLIICDTQASGTDGVKLVATLRCRGERAPILVVSSLRTLESLAQALSAGADDYLQKPIDLHDLRNSISLLMSRSIERERSAPNERSAPLTGAVVRVETHQSEPALVLTASTNSPQLESFQRVCERMAASEISIVERMHLHLALEELLQNAREWGNRFDAAKTIRLTFTPKVDRVQFCIEDQGEGFDPGAIPDPSIDPKAHIKCRITSGKRIGGWGLFIARKRMDDISFNPKGNQVCVTKLFKHAPKPDLSDRRKKTSVRTEAGRSGTRRITKE